MWPKYNGNLNFEEQFSPNSLSTKLDTGFDQQRRIIVVQTGAFDISGADKKFNGMLKMELPFMVLITNNYLMLCHVVCR